MWWPDLPDHAGSRPGFRRPVVVVRGEAADRSRIAIVDCVPLTSNPRWADAPGNVSSADRVTRLPRDSIANVPQVVTLDKSLLADQAGQLPRRTLQPILAGTGIIPGRQA